MKLKTLIGVTAALFLCAPAEALTWKEFWQPFVDHYNNPQYTTKKEVTQMWDTNRPIKGE